MPLPFLLQCAVEVVADHKWHVGFAKHWFAHCQRHSSLFVAYHRPSVYPSAWGECEHSSHSVAVLEYDSPPVALCVVDYGALSYVWESGEVVEQDGLLLVWSGDLVGTVAELSALASVWP